MVSLGFLLKGARVFGPGRCIKKGALLPFSRGNFVIKEENILAQEHKGRALT